MNKQKLHASFGSFLLTAALALASIPAAYADDVDIYLQAAPNNPAKPVVVLALDLNLDVTDIVCSNILADPNTLTGALVDATACKLLQESTVLPILGQAIGQPVGDVLGLLLGENSLLGGLLGGLGGLSDVLTPIIGTDSIIGGGLAVTQLDVIRLLLYQLLHQLVGVNLAIMVSHANTCEPEDFVTPRRNTTGCSNGAYFLLEPTELLEDNINDTLDGVLARLAGVEVNLADLTDGLGGNPVDTDVFPPFQGKEIYYELYRYFTGGEIYNATVNDDDFLVTPDPDTGNPNYTSPLDNTTCQDIHVINVMLTDSQADDESDAAILADFNGVDYDNSGAPSFEEVIKYLDETGFSHNGLDYKVKSKFLLNGVGTGGIGGLLGNATSTLGSLPIGLNPLATPFVTKENFQPVNPASVSFGGPQPIFRRSDFSQAGDFIYQGMFKPANQAVWRGNLKKLKFDEASAGNELLIVDALDTPAIGNDGNINPEALTFWTVESLLPATNPEAGEVNGRDGKATDLGGAGMFLMPPRTVPTKANPNNAKGSGSDVGSNVGARMFYQKASLTPGDFRIAALELNNAVFDDLDAAIDGDEVDAAALVTYARGYDVPQNYENDRHFLKFLDNLVSGVLNIVFGLLNFLGCLFGGCTPETPPPRAWVMGDVLHSHPLPIDYGNDNIRIFTGSNLGFMHQFRDQELASESSSFEGQEVWRLAPRSLLANLDEWHRNQATADDRPYGVDGAPAAWIEDFDGIINASDGDHVYLYFGLRRGGNGYYALNVTNPDATPMGLWSISNSQADFAELGLSFSTPSVGRIRTLDQNNVPVTRTVLVFGGGYDSNKDVDKDDPFVVGTNDTIGNAIFIVDAETGALIWKARNGSNAGSTTANGKTVWEHPDFDDGIPSDVTTLDTTGDGFIDRLYVGDMGGRIWRADIGSATIDDWKAAPIANLGRQESVNNNVANDRRFFERPDVVRVSIGPTGFFTIVIGSGNRASPLNRSTENFLYVVKDSGLLDTTASATPATQSDLVDFDNNCATTADCKSLLDPTQVAAGWRIRLGPTTTGVNAVAARAGEKALSSPTTIGGKVLFTSFVPPNLSVSGCTPQEGTGFLYAVDLLTGKGVVDLYAQDGEAEGNVGFDRSTRMAAAGIPAGVRYIRPETFIGGDFSLINVAHRDTWRTYWRERDGER